MYAENIALSVCVITKNEEHKLPTCLNSVRWASEVIVVDDFSSDATSIICANFKNVKYFIRKFDGFGMQKNHAISLATNEWILNIDADEEVTPELQAEIQSILKENSPCSGYWIRRKNLWFGKYNTDKYPGSLRFFKKSTGRFNESYVHEKVELDGTTGQLQAVLLHKPSSFENLQNHCATYAIKYGKLAAKDYYKRGKRITALNFLWKTLLLPIVVFVREYLVKKRFLLGRSGLYISLCSALCYHTAYVNLARIQKDHSAKS